MITLSTSLVTSYLNVRAGLPATDATTSSAATTLQTGAQRRTAAARIKDLATAPWTTANTPNETVAKSRLAKIMAGQSVVQDATKTASGARRSDQEQLFGAYKALDGLRLITERAQSDGVDPAEMLRLQERFRAGMGDVSKYLSAMDLQRVFAPVGAKPEALEGVYGLRRGRTEYVTAPVFKGALADAVPGFQSIAGFTLVANPGEVGEKTVAIDLSAMGATPRTLDAVIGFVNTKLSDAGLTVRMSRVLLPRAADAKSTDPDSYALSLKGAASEELSFQPLATSAAVTALTVGGPANVQTARLTKFADAADGDPLYSATVNGDPLRFKGNVATGLDVRAAARGDDGSTYVVGESSMPLDGNLGVRGSADLVLTKFDSAGRRVWTRALGASQSGSGYAVAVGADGTVAVAGAFKGIAATEKSAGESDAVVATFTADGADGFVRRLGGTKADEAKALTIGADGTIYVGGRTKSDLSGANGGGWDGFVASFSAAGVAGFTRQFADVGDGGVTALAVGADGVFAAGDGSGSGTVRKLDLAGADVWSLSTGPLGTGGTISSIAVDGAQIAIAGAASATDLGLGGASAGTGGAGVNGFVAAISNGAAPTTVWTRTFGGDQADAAASVAISGGQIYIAATEGALKADAKTQITRATLTKFDAATGAQAWTKRVGAEGERAIGVLADGAGASDLDAFGLPQGDLVFEPSSGPLVERSALRAGDSFSLRIDGGSLKTIAIDADDTMKDLVTKLNGVLRSSGKAEVITSNNSESLTITAADGRRIDLVAGPEGKDALAILGLPAGEARKPKATVSGASSRTAAEPPVMPLNFREDLAFSDAFSARKVRLDIERVQNAVRTAFEFIYNPPAARKNGAAKTSVNSTAPSIQQQRQLANYQAGLARLTAGTTTSTSTDPTLSLFGFST
jgi:hypothetical protein